MLTEYLEGEIEIQPRKGKVFPFSFQAPGGEARGNLRLPTEDATYQALAKRLAELDTDEEMLCQLGQILFDSLFQGKVKEVYVRTQGRIQSTPGLGLRLKLNIAATETEVAGLPWEFLYDTDQGGPLAMLDTSVVRYLPQQAVIPHLKASLPLKLLLTGAQPQEMDQVLVEREFAAVQEALAELTDQRRVQIVPEPHLSRSKLQRLLRQGFHVWHFIGHGGFRPGGTTGQLFLEDATGSAEPVSAQELKILLRGSDVRLIMLDACEGAKLATDTFRSLAPALINAQVPAVIAMQFVVRQESTRAFAGEFYRALAEGLPIDGCVLEGRKAVMGATGLSAPEWGIPVVYTRAPDGRLFDLPDRSTPGPASTTPPSQQSGVNISIGYQNQVDNTKIEVGEINKRTTSGSTIIYGGPSTTDDRAEEIAAIAGQIKEKRRRLRERRLQSAKAGYLGDPLIKLDIEDLEKEIAQLERDLAALNT